MATEPAGKYQRYLRHNLVFGRSNQKLATLLFCIEYAQRDHWGAPGVWRDIERAFSSAEMKQLYADLDPVNDFRNTRVAHVEAKLDNADEARGRWYFGSAAFMACSVWRSEGRSPFRVPVARLAAAQAALEKVTKDK